MKQKLLSLIGVVTLTAGVTACTGFEHSETIIPPTAPTLPSAPGGGSGTMTGTWSSVVPLELNSWSCGSFQWSITEQTNTSLAGTFYAVCASVVLVQGTASGQLNAAGTEVALRVSGTATIQSVITCPFELTGTGYIEGRDAIRIPYSGTTCLGPVHGEETLRRPGSADEPPPPPPVVPDPDPATPPPAGENPNHLPPGPLTFAQAEQVIYAAGREFPHLTAAPPSEQEGIRRAEELLLRIIWHLKLYGFDAARQRNPSGAISNDKINIFIQGNWHAYDIFYDLGRPGVPMTVMFYAIEGENPIAYPGIPD